MNKLNEWMWPELKQPQPGNEQMGTTWKSKNEGKEHAAWEKAQIKEKLFFFIIGVNHNWLLNENSIPLIRL